MFFFFFFSSRRRHTRSDRDWSSDVCSSDLYVGIHTLIATYNYASLWVAMSVCIPTYMLASGLIAGGMSWIQAVLTILLGNLIVLIPMLLNAHAGTRYGIPFPVFVRASFGVRGANIPAILRALVACGWFGIQAWIGGGALHSEVLNRWGGAGKLFRRH